MSITTSRRAVLTAALAATLAIPTPDPIYGAMARHAAAFAAFDAATDGPDESMYAALAAWTASTKNLIATVPTTRAGLAALETYMKKPRNEHIGRSVRWPWPGSAVMCSMSEHGGPWLLARHAAAFAA